MLWRGLRYRPHAHQTTPIRFSFYSPRLTSSPLRCGKRRRRRYRARAIHIRVSVTQTDLCASQLTDLFGRFGSVGQINPRRNSLTASAMSKESLRYCLRGHAFGLTLLRLRLFLASVLQGPRVPAARFAVCCGAILPQTRRWPTITKRLALTHARRDRPRGSGHTKANECLSRNSDLATR